MTSKAEKQFCDHLKKFIKDESVLVVEKLQLCINDASKKDAIAVLNFKEFMKVLVAFKQQVYAFGDHFQQDKLVQLTIKNTFNEILKTEMEDKTKKSKNTILTYVIDYCDCIIRNMSENQSINNDEFEFELHNIIQIFKIAVEKDLIQEHLRRQLARRLLSYGENETPILDERSLLVKLNMEFGISFTYHMNNMICDLSHSRDIVQSYHGVHESILFKPIVLTQGYWPASISRMKIKDGKNLNVPLEMSLCMASFNEYYRNITQNGKKLTWSMDLGSVTLVARFASGNYDMTIDPYLASTLCLFNEHVTEINASKLSDLLNLVHEKDALALLTKLASTKLQILTLKDTGYYEVNELFKSRAKKIKLVKIAASSINLSEKENTDIQCGVINRDRAFIIEACCVRIMKSRKQITHQRLVQEVTQQLLNKFVPDPKMIKQRIDALIEREYIERDSTDNTVYVYLA